MKSSTKNWIMAGMALIILLGVFWLGYSRYPVWNEIKPGKDSIIYIHDTVPHVIVDTFPFYIIRKDSVLYRDPVWMDSVIQAAKIDTQEMATIFREYYAFHPYERKWADSLISIIVNDTITQNRPENNNFTYKLLKPTTIIDNTKTEIIYSKYIYIGGSVSIPNSEFSNFGLYAALPRTLFGVSYMPWQKGVMATVGFKIIKIK